MRAWLVVLSMLVGCDRLLGINSFPPPPVDADGIDAENFVPCSQMSMLADNFSDGALTHLWPNVYGSPSPTEQSGDATLRIVTSGSAYTLISTERYFDLRNSQLSLEITDSGLVDGQYDLELDSQQAGFGLQITRTATNLIFAELENNSPNQVASIPVDPTIRYWRIANHGKITSWETSTDGVTYITQATAMNVPFVGFMAVTIQAAMGPSNAGFVVTVADVNGGMPSGSACPIAELHDDFGGTAIDPQWSRSTVEDGTLVEGGGDLTFTMGKDNQNVLVALIASTFYDFSDGTLAVEIPQMIDTSNSGDTLRVAIGTVMGSTADFVASGGGLSLETNGMAVNSTTYDSVMMRWLRVSVQRQRPALGSLTDDGRTYTTLLKSGDLTGLDRTDVRIQIEGHSVTADSAVIDNVNVAP